MHNQLKIIDPIVNCLIRFKDTIVNKVKMKFYLMIKSQREIAIQSLPIKT